MTIQTISSHTSPLETRCRCLESRLENAATRVAQAALGVLSTSFSMVSLGLTFVNSPVWLIPAVLFGGVAMACFAEAFSRPPCPVHDRHITVVQERSSTPNIIYCDRRPWYTNVWPRWQPRPVAVRAPLGRRATPVGRRETSWTPAPTRAPVGRRDAPMPRPPEPIRAPVGRREAPRATWTPQPSAPPPRRMEPMGGGLRAPVNVRR